MHHILENQATLCETPCISMCDALLFLYHPFNNLVTCYSMWLSHFCIMFMIIMYDAILCPCHLETSMVIQYFCVIFLTIIYDVGIYVSHVPEKHLWHYNMSVASLLYPSMTQIVSVSSLWWPHMTLHSLIMCDTTLYLHHFPDNQGGDHVWNTTVSHHVFDNEWSYTLCILFD